MGLDITVRRLKKKAKSYITEFDDFPDWAKELVTFKTLKFYNWKEYSKLTGIDYNDCPLQEAFDDSNNLTYCYYKSDTPVIIHLSEVPTYNKKVPVICWEEVGYQRKGMNDKFYREYKDYYVWTKAELERYRDEYAEDKEEFQSNIINNFIEGKDCVSFDW